MLRLENISKSYGSIQALKNVNLVVEEGEYLAIVGPSGCGKTTLLKIIAGIEKPTKGRVIINGRDVTNLPTSARKFGYVFQNIALFPHLTAKDNIAYPLFLKNMPKEEAKKFVFEFANMFGISQFLQRYPREMPTGSQQSCGIARALATQHKLMLLDEPLSALDARVRKKLRQELRRFMKDFSITAIHVTHDQEEAMAVADKICVMRSGEIVEYGKPSEVYRNPKTLFGAFFIDENNFLFAKVEKAERRVFGITGCGDRIEIDDSYASLANELVVLCIRPENIGFGEGIRARYSTNVFFGSHVMHIFDYCNQKIKMLSYNVNEKFNYGEEISLKLPKDEIRVFRIPPEGFNAAISLEKER